MCSDHNHNPHTHTHTHYPLPPDKSPSWLLELAHEVKLATSHCSFALFLKLNTDANHGVECVLMRYCVCVCVCVCVFGYGTGGHKKRQTVRLGV